MMNELKKIMLAGVGTVATAYEKVDLFIGEMIEKGKITVEDGKELSQELKKNVKEKSDEAKDLVSDKLDNIRLITREELFEILSVYNYAKQEDVDNLKDRVLELEYKLNKDNK